MRSLSNNGRLSGPQQSVVQQPTDADAGVGAVPVSWSAPESIEPPPGLDWRRLLSALVRHRWMIVSGTLLGVAAGFAVTKVIRPQYAVQSMIWIDQDARRGTDVMTMSPNQSFDASAWTDLVRSAQVLDTVVRAMGLHIGFEARDSIFARGFHLGPQFRTGGYRLKVNGGQWTLLRKREIVATGGPADSIGTSVGFRWLLPKDAPDADFEFDVLTEREAANQLGEAISAHIGPEGNFLRLSLRGEDARHTAAILNAVSQRYVAVGAELRRKKISEITTVLGARAAEAAQALRRAEDQFESHREQSILLPSDNTSVPDARGGELPGGAANTEYLAARRAREGVSRAKSALDRVAQAGRSDADIAKLEDLAAVDKDPDLSAALKELSTKRAELRALVYRYSDAYPPVARLQEEIAELKATTIPQLAGRLAGILGEQQGEIETGLQRDVAQLKAMPARAVQESRLRRNVEMAQQQFTSLQGKYDAARVADESLINPVRLLDEAVAPEAPVANLKPRILLVALGAGFALSIAMALAVDRLDPRVRYPKQVTGEMGLTVLGALPHLPHSRKRTALLDAPMLEALRGVRLNLAYAYGSSNQLTFTISSPGSSDGKSFLSANLARTFAEGGQRVILIDGDLRRGVLHRRLSHQRRPGLADYLLGHTELSKIIHHTSFDRFDMIPAGSRVADAPELLGRATTAHMLSTLRQDYDVVICDSPPLAAGIDAFVLGAATGHLVLVLRAGRSLRDIASSKLSVLDRMPVRVLGAVLNDVQDRAVYNSYSYYLPGYEASDESTGKEERSPVLL